MYCRLDLDLLNFVFVCLSALRPPYMSSTVTQVRMFRYHVAFDSGWISMSKFLFYRKFTLKTIYHLFTFAGRIYQSHESFSGQSRAKQCSFMSLSALIQLLSGIGKPSTMS